MKRRLGSLCIFLGLAAAPAWPQLSVSIESPLLGPGMESLQALVESNLLGFSSQIEAYAMENFDKPLFMEGFSRAASVSALVPGAMHETALPFVSLGSAASVYAQDLSPRTFEALGAMASDIDVLAGACTQPILFRAGFPLKGLKIPGFDLGGGLGLMDARAGIFGLQAVSLGLAAGLRLGSPSGGIVKWEAVRVEAGAVFALTRLQAAIRTGRISQTVPIDPDGDIGPLVPFNASFSIEPEINAGILTRMAGIRLQASTGLNFFRAISLSLCAGLSFSGASSALDVRAQDVLIIVDGYLSSLVEAPGSIDVSGRISEYSLYSWDAYLSPGLRFAIGAFSISIPLVWRIPGGLGTGIFIGMKW